MGTGGEGILGDVSGVFITGLEGLIGDISGVLITGGEEILGSVFDGFKSFQISRAVLNLVLIAFCTIFSKICPNSSLTEVVKKSLHTQASS